MLTKNSCAGPLQRIHCNAAVLRVSFSVWALSGVLLDQFGSISFFFFFCWSEETKDARSAQTLYHAAVQTCHPSWCNCCTSTFLCCWWGCSSNVLYSNTQREISIWVDIFKHSEVYFFQMGWNLRCKNTVFPMLLDRLLTHTAGLSVTQWVLCVQGVCLTS